MHYGTLDKFFIHSCLTDKRLKKKKKLLNDFGIPVHTVFSPEFMTHKPLLYYLSTKQTRPYFFQT